MAGTSTTFLAKYKPSLDEMFELLILKTFSLNVGGKHIGDQTMCFDDMKSLFVFEFLRTCKKI